MISRLRDEAFGKLKEDPEIASLRTELAAAAELIDGIRTKLDAAERRRLAG
jgi:hypothetical protein